MISSCCHFQKSLAHLRYFGRNLDHFRESVAFTKDGLANSQLLTSLRVRGRPLWEFACLVGSSGALLARLREFTDLSTLHEYSLLVVRVHFWVSFPWASFWSVLTVERKRQEIHRTKRDDQNDFEEAGTRRNRNQRHTMLGERT